jgi:hypothetical protein
MQSTKSLFKIQTLNPKRNARNVSFLIIRLHNDKLVKQTDYLSISEVLFPYENMHIHASFGQVFNASHRSDCTVGREYTCHPDSEEHNHYYIPSLS